MGYYIDGPTTGKDRHLIETMGAEEIPGPMSWDKIPANKALVCVVHNGMFDAAALVYSARELEAFRDHSNPFVTWLMAPKEAAHKAAGYVE